MKKTKEYKRFNFPNSLTAFEQYYYYLLEFDVIPKSIPGKMVEKIFMATAKDFLEGFLEFNTFSFIIDNLYVKYSLGGNNIDYKIDKLMSDLVANEEFSEKELRKRLKIFKLQ